MNNKGLLRVSALSNHNHTNVFLQCKIEVKLCKIGVISRPGRSCQLGGQKCFNRTGNYFWLTRLLTFVNDKFDAL